MKHLGLPSSDIQQRLYRYDASLQASKAIGDSELHRTTALSQEQEGTHFRKKSPNIGLAGIKVYVHNKEFPSFCTKYGSVKSANREVRWIGSRGFLLRI